MENAEKISDIMDISRLKDYNGELLVIPTSSNNLVHRMT